MAIYNPHKPKGRAVPCTAWHLINVAEGVQCSNCLELVIDNRPKPERKGTQKNDQKAKSK